MPESLVATLPMYDWPAVKPATDQLWSSLRQAFIDADWDAPRDLNREEKPQGIWRKSNLLLGQTCGYPYVSQLRDTATLIGAPDYGVPGCKPGWYRSAVVVRDAPSRQPLKAFRGAAVALNDLRSQSGFFAIMHAVAEEFGDRVFFGAVRHSGSHARSMEMVAAGEADIAAIDFVSWRLACAHLGAAQDLRVLALTDPTPGLPYIASSRFEPGPLGEAIESGLQALDAETKSALGIRGFMPMVPSDYDVIAERASKLAPLIKAHGLGADGA